jgi:exonuclease SbcC
MARIKNFEFKNVRSYGNTITKIPFDLNNGLYLINGKNGGGKTSIVEGLEFAIYGKSSRVAIKDLPNWFNDSLYTSIEFETDDNRNVILKRGISPDYYDLRIDNEDKTKDKNNKENKANKTKLDALVEDELFGIPSDVFANNILLSIHDFKSFVSMKVADKRKIIDKIFQTDIFNDMSVVLKQELKDYKEKLNIVVAKIESKRQLLEQTNVRVNDIKSTMDDNIDVLINSLTNDIQIIESKIKNQIIDRNKYQSDLSLNSNEYNEYYKKVNDAERMIQSKYDLDFDTSTTKYNSDLKSFKYKNDLDMNTEISNLDNIKKTEISTIVHPNVSLDSTKNHINSKIDSLKIEYTNTANSIKTQYDIQLSSISKDYNFNSDLNFKNYEKSKSELNEIILDITNKNNNLTLDKNKILSKLNDIKFETSLSSNKLNLYNNDKCPSCEIDLIGTKFHVDKKQILIDSISKNNDIINQYTKNVSDIDILISESNTLLTSKTNDNTTLYSNYISSKNELDNKFNIDSNSLKLKKDSDIQILENKIRTEIDKLNVELTNIVNTETTKYNTLINDINDKYYILIENVKTKYDTNLTQFNESLKIKYDSDVLILKNEMSNKKTSIMSKSKDKIEYFTSEKDRISKLISDIDSNVDTLQNENRQLIIRLTTLQNGDSTKTLFELNNISSQLESEISILMTDKAIYDDNIWKRENTQFLIGENGLKKIIMRKILPMFNSTIFKITSMFDFKYRFSFDDNFDVHLSYCGKPVPLTTSRGEGKIMDIIVILSTLQLILMKHPKINILFLDEIFSNLDVDNIAKAVNILRDYSRLYNLNIFVMSHTTVPKEMFDRIIDVEFDGNFSKII